MDYNALHPSTRMELAAILEKDPMTACTAEESELLWEKRHFLYMRAEVKSCVFYFILWLFSLPDPDPHLYFNFSLVKRVEIIPVRLNGCYN